jgi:hypothetical protein
MKKVVKLCIALLILLTIILSSLTNVFPNIWHLITARGFVIPKESSVFTFKVTKMNEGSGEWWLYAEDRNYYYTVDQVDTNTVYQKMEKSSAEQIKHFDKHDYKTWLVD